MDKKVRVAVVGLGKMGMLPAGILGVLPNVELVALCEKSRIIRKFSKKVFNSRARVAAGYLSPQEAINYMTTLPNIRGIVVGASREKHANEKFRLLRENFATQVL